MSQQSHVFAIQVDIKLLMFGGHKSDRKESSLGR